MGFTPGASGNITLAGDIVGPIGATSIPANSITSGKIAAGAITSTQIASGAVTASSIPSGAVGATQIATGGVTTAKIAAGAVTLNEMGTTDKASLRNRTTHTGLQPISSVTDLQLSLDGLSPIGHTHDTGDVSGLDSALNTKVSTSPYWVPIYIRAYGSTTIPAGFPTGGIVFTRQS
ncbi:MAG: hypothetical protein ACOH18_00175 [Candidatus Saccharimonadaceae bacterium]